MKKPQRERVYRKKVQPEEIVPDQGASVLGPSTAWPLNAWSTGFRWLEVWMRGWQSIMEAAQPGHARPGSPEDSAEERRRIPGLPWVPRVEASVIPLRRRSDPPASEATRISMRVMLPSLPWNGAAGNVLTLDTLVPRRDPEAPDTAAADVTKAASKPPRKAGG